MGFAHASHPSGPSRHLSRGRFLCQQRWYPLVPTAVERGPDRVTLAVQQPRTASGFVPGFRSIGALLGIGAITATHAYVQRLPGDQTSPLIVASHLFAVLMLLGLLWLSTALGLRIVRLLDPESELGIQTLLFSACLGFGAVAYLVLAVGFLGFLHAWALALMLGALAIVMRSELSELARRASGFIERWRAERRALASASAIRLAVLLAELALLMAAVRALAPPTGFDGLLYHLTAPLEFLRLGRFVALPELPQANMPFTLEMLFLVGIAFGTAELSGLLHVTFAALTALATWGLGRRLFGTRVAWMAAVIFLSSSALAMYGPQPNVDYGWAFFDFMAVYAFVVWLQTRRLHWLTLAGTAVGLSLGSKYLGALTGGLIGLALIFELRTLIRARPFELLKTMTRYALPAAIVASPWYVKNWLWLGHPAWSHVVGGPEFDTPRYFASQMHGGRELLDYLLLPLRLYGGDYEGALTQPPLLLLLVPLYIVAPKTRALNYLIALAVVHFAAWAVNIQTVRYLLPVFPALGLVAAHLLDQAIRSARFPKVAQRAAPWLVALSMLYGTGVGLAFLVVETPFAQLVGMQSRNDYLDRLLSDFPAVRYLNDHRDAVSRVLVVGEARLFYLEPPARVVPNMTADGLLSGDPVTDLATLRTGGFSHILVGQYQLRSLSEIDPEGRVQRWREAFDRLHSAFLTVEFESPAASVYRLPAIAPEGRQP